MKCKVNIGRETFDGEFMGMFQFSEVMSPSLMVTGHTGGVVAYPVAVVKVGRFLKQVRATSVHFEEEEPSDYIDSMEEFQKSNFETDISGDKRPSVWDITNKIEALAKYNAMSNKSRDTLFEREVDKKLSDLMMCDEANKSTILKGTSNMNAFSDIGCKVNEFHKETEENK